MSNETIRIVVCGDEAVGKSSLITSLIKETFVPNIQHVIPSITISKQDYPNTTSTNIPKSILLIDTSSSDIETLQKELKQADVIWLVYSDHYTYERISIHWMNMFRSMGVNLPIVLCSNKLDLANDTTNNSRSNSIADEFIPLLNEFKEIEACIKCSAKENYNVTQAFYLCQRAIMHPISPLYDSKEGNLKPAAISALKRVFFLCDKDQDGYLSDAEILDLNKKCFGKIIERNDLNMLKDTVDVIVSGNKLGLSEDGFIILNKLYAEKGRHETVWGILRAFHYTDSLSLNDKFLYPKLDVSPNASVELGPSGYRFLVDLFLLFDKDNDGGLSELELNALFCPTPGIPKFWQESNFPSSIVCNERGYVTLQGWLAQWNLTTFLDYRTTLEYLGYLGFESQVKALKVTKTRKRKARKHKSFRGAINDRNVFNCFVLGAPNSGKTSLLESFLGRQYSESYSPTIQPRIAVKDIELGGGKQCYLILEELGELESAILANPTRLDQCDVICYTYDSSDPESFQYLDELRKKHPALDELPVVFVALKADLDRQQQRFDVQPDSYTRDLYLPPPLHISSTWPSSLNELFVQLVNAAQLPHLCTPGLEPEPDTDDLSPLLLTGGAISFMTIVSIWIWKSSMQSAK